MDARRIVWPIALATLVTSACCRNRPPAALGREDIPSIRAMETVQLDLTEFP